MSVLQKYLITNQVSPYKMPTSNVWAFCGLPKRGKTTGAVRFNESNSVEKTIVIDLEKCVSKYPQFQGANVLNVGSYDPPMRPKKDKNGKVIHDKHDKEIYEPIPVKERGFIINSEELPIYSMTEAMAILNVASNEGELKQYDTIVIDTVDALQTLVEDWVIREHNKENEEKVYALADIGSYGSGWDKAKRKLMSVILQLKDIIEKNQMELCLCIHSKTTTQIENKIQRDPALRNATALTLFGECGIIGYVDSVQTRKKSNKYGTIAEGKEHVISFDTRSEVLTGGTRLSRLVGKTLPFSYNAIKEEYEDQNKGEHNE